MSISQMPVTWLKIAYFYSFSPFFSNLRILLMNIHDQQKHCILVQMKAKSCLIDVLKTS